MRENNSNLNVKNISKWFVVLWIIVAISVLGICIIMCYDNSFKKNNNNMGILFGIILLCVFSIVIILAIKNTEKIYVSLQKYDEIDCVTGEFNDNYMKNNISNIIQNNDNCVLIGVVIENIEDIARIVGIEKTNIIIKDFYKKIQLTIRNNKDEILIHSYFGNFKILKNINSMGEILYYIKKINEINIDLKLTHGIYRIDKNIIDYDRMCMYTSIARSQLIRGKNYGIYTEESYKKELTNINLQEEIQNGIEHFEFKAWFQPKYSVDGKALCGAEALARWEKNNEMISPNVFIPICEATGQIKNIDFLILDNVCKQLRKWIDEDKNIVPISVNMSRNYFDDPEILDNIAMILKFYNVPEQYVEFEITETSIENSEENFKNVINILHTRGHQIALDDFGIGYSSIKTVGTMGFDIIKLDKIFVDGIGNKKWEDIIIYAINLAKSVKAVVIAEGVENKKQLDFLAKNNCDIIQGYYFGKPMNCKEFEKLI